MRIAATCIAALAAFGVTAEPAVWDDPRAAWSAFDAVVIRSCWDYHYRAREFAHWLARLEDGGARVLNGVPGVMEVTVQSPPGLPQLTIRLRPSSLVRWGFETLIVIDVFLLMLAESACIPVPSEVIMMFGGALSAGAVAGAHPALIGIVAAAATANPYGPKAMRASAGSVFRLPLLLRTQPAVSLALQKLEAELGEKLIDRTGKELMLNTLLRTSGTYTTVGPFLGLTKVSLTPAATDTMTTLVTTNAAEFTNYTVGGSAVRGTAVFGSATSTGSTPSNVTTSTASSITYTITGAGGTVYGCFLVTGTGAVNTQSSTAGTLYSEGNFTTAKIVTAGDTVAVTYSTTATS